MPRPVGVLMYHKVGAEVEEPGHRFLNVSAPHFALQMRVLHRLGFRAICFAEVARQLGEGGPAARSVCITFDDGYRNIAASAAPVLRDLGWPATVFVPTDWAGNANRWDEANGKPVLPLMGWDELGDLAGSGWEIAGHTLSHPRLAEMEDAAALAEIRGGREAIADRVGVAPSTFCYPYGSLNERTPGLVREAGFGGACTTRSGWARPGRDPFTIPRVKVASRDGVVGMLYRLLLRCRYA